MSLRKLAVNNRLVVVGAGLVFGTALFLGATTPAQAQIAYAIANYGTSLISFNVNAPGTILSTKTISGAASALDAIDFRPSTGQLYGYLDATDTLYTVNTSTGAVTAVSGSVSGTTNTELLGMDFNPVADRVRVVDEAAENVVFGPTSSTPISTTPTLFYGAGDAGASSPYGVRVIEDAYTNNLAGAASTTLYGIDYGTSSLVTINTSTGQLTTVGSLGIALPTPATGTPYVGFDIFTALGGANTAYAILDTSTGASSGTAPGFFTINLGTGAASLIGSVGGGSTGVYSLAVTPIVSAAAPEPASLIFAAAGLLPFAVVRRRRRRSA